MEIAYATGIVLLALSYLLVLFLMRMLVHAVDEAAGKPLTRMTWYSACTTAALLLNAGYVAGGLLGWWRLYA